MTAERAFGMASMRTQNDDSKVVIASLASSRTCEDGEDLARRQRRRDGSCVIHQLGRGPSLALGMTSIERREVAGSMPMKCSTISARVLSSAGVSEA